MQPSQVVTLTTDFGLGDSYVGTMKGVMLGIFPQLQLVDLTHAIAPQDVAAAGFQLGQAMAYFPPGTVHLAVVDPGVGGDRLPLAIALDQAWLVGPDNGLFDPLLQRFAPRAAVRLNRPQYWRTPRPSRTFHGRDIFAPAAAHLAAGVPLEQLGDRFDPVSNLISSSPALYRRHPDGIWGQIQAIDHFGNLVTSIPAEALAAGPWQLQLGPTGPGQARAIDAVETYGDRPPGSPLALVGSHGWVEVAVNGGSAEAYFQARVGDGVRLVEQPPKPLAGESAGGASPMPPV